MINYLTEKKTQKNKQKNNSVELNPCLIYEQVEQENAGCSSF